eukprot:2256946-Alexandrium_andersonii.AAC.1
MAAQVAHFPPSQPGNCTLGQPCHCVLGPCLPRVTAPSTWLHPPQNPLALLRQEMMNAASTPAAP